MKTIQSFVRLAGVMSLGMAMLSHQALAASKPTLTKLSPSSVNAGGAAFTLTVTGTNYISGAKIYFGAYALTTKYVKSTELTATVPTSLLGKAAKVSVTVSTTGGKSGALSFTILPPKPVITKLVPATAIAGGPKFTVSIEGKNFITGAKAKWGATALTTTYKSSTLLTASIPASLIAKSGTANVTVTTTGGTTTASKFTVTAPVPIISELSPSSAIAGNPQFTLTILGYNFIAGAAAKWNSTALVTTYKSATEVTAMVPATLVAKQGTADITVTTSKGKSAAAVFTIKPPRPAITKLSPSSVIANGPAFTLSITGTSFVSGAVAKWIAKSGTTTLTTTYKSSTLVTAAVPAALITSAGTATVTVTTPSGTSPGSPIAITQPKPTISGLNPNSAIAGQSGFTLTINGSGFISGASASWTNSKTSVTTALASTIVSSTQITAAVPTNLIATAGSATVTVTTSAGTSAPSTFNIVSPAGPACANDGSGNAALNGAYSFQFTQVDPTKNGEPNMNVGAFTADGDGNISGGISDANGPYFSSEVHSTFTGTYSIGPDNRGLLTLNYTGGATANFCFALNSLTSGVAGGASLISDITNPQVDAGAIFAQGSTGIAESTVKGSWAFGVQGMKLSSGNSQEQRGASAGYFTLDGNGGVSAGELDTSQDGFSASTLKNSYTAQTTVSGGSYTLQSTGAGTLTLDYAGGGTGNFIFYVAGTNELLLLSSSPGGSGSNAVMAGKALLRPSSVTFGTSSLNGSSVLVAQSASQTNSTRYDQRLVQAGVFTWNGAGKYTETYDQNDAGDIATQQTVSSTSYSVDSSGRATIGGTTPATYAYLVGPNQGFAIQGDVGVSFTYFEGQTVPSGGFKLSSFDGDYSEGSLWYGYEEQKVYSGEVASNGAGTLTGNLDVAPILTGVVDSAPRMRSGEGGDARRPRPMDEGIDETYSGGTSGRYVVMNGLNPVEALYVVSAGKAYAIDLSGAQWLPIEEFDHQ